VTGSNKESETDRPASPVAGWVTDWDRPDVPFRSSRTRATVVTIAIGLSALLSVLTIVHQLMFAGMIDALLSGEAGTAEAQAYDDTTASLAIAGFGVLIVCWIAYLAWLSRAVDNAPALGAGITPHSARGAIGWWFVPFASLVIPYQIVTDLHNRLASDPDSANERTLLLAWWLTWIVGNYFGFLVGRVGGTDPTIDDLRTLANAQAAAEVISLVAAVLAILVVRRIQRRADVRAALLEEERAMRDVEPDPTETDA